MICRVGETVHRGRAVTVDADVPPERLTRAVREGGVDGPADEPSIAVTARQPGPLYEHVGCLHPEMGLRTRTALARAGRSRGLSTPMDAEIRATRERLAGLDPATPALDEERQASATSGADAERLRERVAEARGRLRARRRADLATETATAELETAVAELADAETDAVAGRQTLDRARKRVREQRERLMTRFDLEDALGNLERRARAHLVDRLRERYADTVRTVPGSAIDDVGEDPFAVDPVTAGLAIARIGELRAPVVLACERFSSADAAAEWLGAPVVRLRI